MLSRRSALRVSEAMDMVEEFIGEAAELLEQVNIVATEARKIPNIPQYLDENTSFVSSTTLSRLTT